MGVRSSMAREPTSIIEMNDRPSPHPDMLFVEALACLPDDAIVTFGRNYVSAAVMRCVRAPQNRDSVQRWLQLCESVQQGDRANYNDGFICACCMRPFYAHLPEPGEP